MKILIADQFSELGGAQRVLLELLPALQQQGWTPVLAVPGHGPLRTGAETLGIHCEEITCGPFGCGSKSLSDGVRFATQFPKLRSQLKRLVDSFHPEVLYVNAPRLVPAACSLGNHAPPILVHLHSYLKQPYLAALTGRLLQRGHASIIANCRFVLEPLRDCLRNLSVDVIYNGVPDHTFHTGKPRTSRIGVIGRICPEKGQKVFVEAARLVHAALPDLTYILCGGTQFSDPHAESYLHELKQLSAGAPIEFLGWQNDVSDFLRGLDLLVVPSMPLSEATTRVIPEAFSAGVPVLASDLPGIREILKDGETGFLFPPGKPAALANSIREITEMAPERLAVVTANARRRFEEEHSIGVFHRRMISSLQRAGTKARA